MGKSRPERLVKIKQKGILGGVCAGFAYWLGWPTWILRVLTFLVGPGALVYIVLWIFMPAADELPADYDERTS